MTDPNPVSPTPAGGRSTAGLVEEMLRPFQEEAAATRQAIEDRTETQRRINNWLIGFVAVTTVLVTLVLWMLVKDTQRRAQSREILQNNARVSAQIADCTSVTGSCYAQSQARLQATIRQLIASNKAIAVCVKTTDTEAQLDACVKERLDALAPLATP